MSKNSAEVYGAKGKTNLLKFAPEDLVIVDDKDSILFDRRSEQPLTESFVKNIMHYGVLQPIVVRKNPETGKTEVVAGRRRVRAAIEANKQLAKRGETLIEVSATVRRDDDATLGGIMVSENEAREEDSPLNRAEKMQRLMARGQTEADLAITFACSAQTVKNTLALLECCAVVKHAIQSGKLPVTVAYELSKLEPKEQKEKLEKVLESIESTPKRKGRGKKIDAALGRAPSMRSRKEIVAMKDSLLAGSAQSALEWVLGDDDTSGFTGAK